MKKIFPLTILLFCLLLSPLGAQHQEQTITLKDGTVLKGYLVGVRNNYYTIKTKHMGNVTISANDLRSIAATPELPVRTEQKTDMNSMVSAMMGGGNRQSLGALGNHPAMSQLPQLQSELMADPKFMAMVQELMEDGSMMELMAQGDLLTTLTTMDPSQAHNNPTLQKMMQNPKMMKIINYIAEKMVTPK